MGTRKWRVIQPMDRAPGAGGKPPCEQRKLPTGMAAKCGIRYHGAMLKGPKGRRQPAADDAKPERKKLNAGERRALKAADLQLFVKRVGRPAPKGKEPNDRSYSRDQVEAVRHMKPEDFDRFLRDGEDSDT